MIRLLTREESIVAFSLLIAVFVAVAEAKGEILFLFFFRCVAVRSRKRLILVGSFESYTLGAASIAQAT